MMNTKLSKREFYTQTDTRKYKSEWIVFWITIAVNILDIVIAPFFIVATLVTAVCGFGVKTTLDKRWGIPLIVLGVVTILLMIPEGLFAFGMPMALSGWWFYRVLGNLDKAYAQYLETGVVPNLKGQ